MSRIVISQSTLRPLPGASPERRIPIGAEVADGVHFRVWAPTHEAVAVVVEGRREARLEPEGEGYFSGLVSDARAGDRYWFRLDADERLYPDPASRFQPEGPHGPSEVIDPDAFVWSDPAWQGISPGNQVFYEMHVGTFTPEGTWAAALKELPELAAFGVTVLEIMPVNDFSGEFGWGYDGVDLFAPTRLYGSPDDMRRFVDRAHAEGLGVILDVVYNHLGPDGCFLGRFSDTYFSKRYRNEWGDALNYDGPGSQPVREFVLSNAAYWMREFHLDGLRIDATQFIQDSSENPVLAEIVRQAREAAGGKSTLIVGENEPQNTDMLRPVENGGFGLDALWNDDFHHSAIVALTGHGEAYFTDYKGAAQEFVSAAKYGFLYQGQRYKWQQKRRGSPALDLRPFNFIHFLENHDQVANSPGGQRLHQATSPGRFRAMTALLLLGPQNPMLFQGQEFCSESPFFYFADHKPELAGEVRKGRRNHLRQFRSLQDPRAQQHYPEPADPETFRRSKLDFSQREKNLSEYLLHRELLRLRREDSVVSGRNRRAIDGAVLDEQAFVLRYFARDDDDRLLVVNLGRDLHLDPAPEPLLAPPRGRRWETLFSTENPMYGGRGERPLDTPLNWNIPGESAALLKPVSDEHEQRDD